jgi:AcrR family transcriptional regulator
MNGTRPRRSQAQRSEATRAALLDAAIDCLVDGGYSRLTVRQVAARAGVSEGAHWHHFASKEELVTEALRRLVDRIAAELLASERTGGALDEHERLGRLLDGLWELHRGELFDAAMEVLLAARTEPPLREVWATMSAEVLRHVTEGAADLVPTLSADPEFPVLMLHALATMRGLAVLAWLPGGDPDLAWRLVRPQLLERAVPA